jgi:CubicO group peptidase (beta-lactamase class C family)
MAMLTLAQRDKLDLDKDVNAYLTSWKLPSNEFTSKTNVTLPELLNHTGVYASRASPAMSREVRCQRSRRCWTASSRPTHPLSMST